MTFARAGFARAYEHPESVSDETLRTYLTPLYATPETTRNLERFVAARLINGETIDIAEHACRLAARAVGSAGPKAHYWRNAA